jgi:RNA polymerase sigma-70 factor, ECF subfamily
VKNDLFVGPADDQRARVEKNEHAQMPASFDDAPLLSMIAQGDQPALATLYRQRGNLIYSLLVQMLVNEMEAQEVLQDTFLQIWRRAGKYDPELSAPMTWIFMIARGLALDRLRAKSRQVTGQAAYEREMVSLELEINVARPAERDELATACTSALNHLPESQGQALQLAFFRGWTHEEIAVATGQPLGTVKGRIRRGLIALRKILKEYHA